MHGSYGQRSLTSADIRAIGAHEVPLLLPGAREFFAQGFLLGKLNESHFVNNLRQLITAGRAVCLVTGSPFRGAIAAVYFDDMATGERCAMEFFWYVHRAERGSLGVRLLSALEDATRDAGVCRLMMMHNLDHGESGLDRIYQRRGYMPREKLFVKVFK
jgi:hypothetical protein